MGFTNQVMNCSPQGVSLKFDFSGYVGGVDSFVTLTGNA